MTRKSALWSGLAAAILLPLAGCRSQAQAWGEANSIIVLAADSLWQQVGDSVLKALEPTFVTVREERTFNVTQISPRDTSWNQLKRFKQILVLGVPEDSWVEPAVKDRKRVAPYVEETSDVWASNQQVSAIVVTREHPAQDVVRLVPEVGARLDSLYRAYAVSRMYQSKPNETLRDTMAASSGFSLLLPTVYKVERQDSLWVMRNWTEIRGELRRTITVTWRAGVDTSSSTEAALAWRQSTLARYKNPGTVLPEPLLRRRLTRGATSVYEVQGAWQVNEGGVPAAGPFLLHIVPCPSLDRTYLVDASLYAPAREKYEYMIQLETLLNTFRCGSEAAAPQSR